jgi:hypothetical protein
MPVKIFRKKPVAIEAIQYTDKTAEEVVKFIGRTKHTWTMNELGTALYLDTLEGGHVASQNDWIIKGIKGEFYPCKPDIFEQTYEEVDVSRFSV